ncbi:hypothetical protein ACFL7E_06035 [Thermodesulfobacteriota bacterium]
MEKKSSAIVRGKTMVKPIDQFLFRLLFESLSSIYRVLSKKRREVPGIYHTIKCLPENESQSKYTIINFLIKIIYLQIFSKYYNKRIQKTANRVYIKRNSRKTRHYFVVTSRGRTATHWLAAKLNSHPNIICTHGRLIPPLSTYHRQTPKVDNIYYHVRPYYIHNSDISIDKYYCLIENKGEALVYGNVHGYSYSTLDKNMESLSRRYVVCNVTRHPISRIDSSYKRMLFVTSFNYVCIHSFQQIFKNSFNELVVLINKKYGVDFNKKKNYLFIVALKLMSDAHEVSDDGVHYKYEDLTQNPSVFKDFVSYITSDSINISDDFIKNAIASEKMNHTHGDPYSIREKYFSWQEWQKAAFREIAKRNKFTEIYKRFDYDLTFLDL